MIVDDIYKLDWPQTTVEGYNESKNEAYIVINFDFKTQENIQKVLQFVSGRVLMVYKNFPKNVKILITFDMRGQDIILSKARSVTNKLYEILNNNILDNNFTIDFLI